MPDLDAAVGAVGALVAARAASPPRGGAQVDDLGRRQVAREVEAAHVGVGLVGAGDRAGDRRDLEVGVDRHRRAPAGPRSRPARRSPRATCVSVASSSASAPSARLELDLVDVAIAAHQRDHRLAVGDVDQRLDEALVGSLRNFDHVVDAALAGRVQLLAARPVPAAAGGACRA